MLPKPSLKFIGLFFLVGFVIFLLSGGLFLLLGQSNGSSGMMRQSGLQFVYPDDVNNLNAQQIAVNSLLISLGSAAIITILAFEFRRRQHKPGSTEPELVGP